MTDITPKVSPPPSAKFAVVLNPGTLFQSIEWYAGSLREAQIIAASEREAGDEVDVMKVVPGGPSKRAYLTTEF